jgi:hypothetical protein
MTTEQAAGGKVTCYRHKTTWLVARQGKKRAGNTTGRPNHRLTFGLAAGGNGLGDAVYGGGDLLELGRQQVTLVTGAELDQVVGAAALDRQAAIVLQHKGLVILP